jgi:hypothetical protein
MTQENSLSDLIIDESAVMAVVLDAKVRVSTMDMPIAKMIATDILLAAILALDLPDEADYAGAMSILASYKDPKIRLALPELMAAIVDGVIKESKADASAVAMKRLEMLEYFFGEECAIEQLRDAANNS